MTKETVLAPERSAMVLIAETVNIFWLRKIEYSPKAYMEVIKNRVIRRAGTKR